MFVADVSKCKRVLVFCYFFRCLVLSSIYLDVLALDSFIHNFGISKKKLAEFNKRAIASFLFLARPRHYVLGS